MDATVDVGKKLPPRRKIAFPWKIFPRAIVPSPVWGDRHAERLFYGATVIHRLGTEYKILTKIS